MNRYVVDASVLVQELIEDTFTANVHQMFVDYAPDDELIVPEFGILECTNVLWKQVRFQGMSQEQAELLTRNFLLLPLRLQPVTGLLIRGLQIGLAHNLALYDSVYIAMAEKFGVGLITVDAKQGKAAQAEGVALKAITDFVVKSP